MFAIKNVFGLEILTLGLGLLLAPPAKAQSASYDASGGSSFSNPLIEQGDKVIESEQLASSQTQQFLLQIRKTVESACTGKLGPMAGPQSCDTYSQGYVDAAKFFIALERKAGGELRIGSDMVMRVGQTESGDAAKVVEAPCDGTGVQSAARGVSTYDFAKQEYEVAAVLYDAETCDNVKPNHPQDGILQIDSRNHLQCNFYFVCGGKVEGSGRPLVARRSTTPARNITSRDTSSGPNTFPGSDPETTQGPGASGDTSGTTLAGGAYGGGAPASDNPDDSYTPPEANQNPIEGYINYEGSPPAEPVLFSEQ